MVIYLIAKLEYTVWGSWALLPSALREAANPGPYLGQYVRTYVRACVRTYVREVTLTNFISHAQTSGSHA